MSTPIPEIAVKPVGVRSSKYVAVSRDTERELYRDVIDLNSAKERTKFAAATVIAASTDTTTDDWRSKACKALEDRLLQLAAAPPAPLEPPEVAADPVIEDPRLPALEEVDEDIRKEAEELLRASDLLKRLVKHFDLAGIVGEQLLALTVYLVFVSAQLVKPLAAIIRGTSSSGKSFCLSRVAEFVPAEVRLDATEVTPKALYKCPPGFLRHRALNLGERSRVQNDETAERTKAQRQLISEGKISQLVPVKIDDQYETIRLEQEGPVASVETTTAGSIFEEDMNRCLLINTDESADQDKRIIESQGARAAGGEPADLERIRLVHHALHRMLPRGDVVIPYAPALASLYRPSGVDSRRHFAHLLQLVKAVALLHFCQREYDSNGRVTPLADVPYSPEHLQAAVERLRAAMSDPVQPTRLDAPLPSHEPRT